MGAGQGAGPCLPPGPEHPAMGWGVPRHTRRPRTQSSLETRVQVRTGTRERAQTQTQGHPALLEPRPQFRGKPLAGGQTALGRLSKIPPSLHPPDGLETPPHSHLPGAALAPHPRHTRARTHLHFLTRIHFLVRVAESPPEPPAPFPRPLPPAGSQRRLTLPNQTLSRHCRAGAAATDSCAAAEATVGGGVGDGWGEGEKKRVGGLLPSSSQGPWEHAPAGVGVGAGSREATVMTRPP